MCVHIMFQDPGDAEASLKTTFIHGSSIKEVMDHVAIVCGINPRGGYTSIQANSDRLSTNIEDHITSWLPACQWMTVHFHHFGTHAVYVTFESLGETHGYMENAVLAAVFSSQPVDAIKTL